MKRQSHSSTSSCNIHPIEFNIEGVCPLCLNERLLVLASPPPNNTIKKSFKKKNLRLFSFLGFFKLRHHKLDHQTTCTISSEDSFISIKFEDNGATSWEKGKESSQVEQCKASSCDHQYQHVTKKKETVPQSMPRPLLTWRKRMSRFVHVISFTSRSSAKVKGDVMMEKTQN